MGRYCCREATSRRTFLWNQAPALSVCAFFLTSRSLLPRSPLLHSGFGKNEQAGVVWVLLIFSCWEILYGTEFGFEEKSGGFGCGEDGVDSAAIFFARWIAFAATDLGYGGASGAGAVVEGKVEGSRGNRQLRSSEGRGHYFSLREAAGGSGSSAGDPHAPEWEEVGDFGSSVGSDGDD